MRQNKTTAALPLATAAIYLTACAAPTQPATVIAPSPSPSAAQSTPAETPQPPQATAADAVQYPQPVQTHMAVADEYFERGYVVWLPDWNQIWVFVQPVVAPGKIDLGRGLMGPDSTPAPLTYGGPWYRFADTFDPAVDMDTDPNLRPPPGKQQPKGGIGKIWRENPELQAALGWALDWERPYKTFINSYAIGVLGKGEGFVQTGRIYTIYASDGALFYVHEEAGIWSRP